MGFVWSTSLVEGCSDLVTSALTGPMVVWVSVLVLCLFVITVVMVE